MKLSTTLALVSAAVLPAVLAQSTTEVTKCFTSGDCAKWTTAVSGQCSSEIVSSGIISGGSPDFSKIATAKDLVACVCSTGTLAQDFNDFCLDCLSGSLKSQAESICSSSNTTTSPTSSLNSTATGPSTTPNDAVKAKSISLWGSTGAFAVILGSLLYAI